MPGPKPDPRIEPGPASTGGAARDQTLDLMRGLALLGVLVIHTFYRFAAPGPERIAFALPALLARPCIALFLFCSGYLTRPDGRTGPLLGRLKRLVLPYLFFSLAAYPFKLWVGIPFDPALIPLDLIMGNTMGIYYYILVLAYCHLIGWWLSRRGVLPGRLMTVFLVCLGLNFVFTSLYDSLWFKFIGPSPYNFYFIWRSPLIWPAFYFLGMLARTIDLRGWAQRNRTLLLGLWIPTAAAICLVFVSGIYNTRTPMPLGYNSPLGTIYSLVTILLLLGLRTCPGWLTRLSMLSYPVYLSHIFFVYIWRYYVRLAFESPSAWLGPLGMVPALAGALAVYWIFKRLLGERSKWVVGA